nr:hypothetical protein [Gemmatimonadaceae bacterium]
MPRGLAIAAALLGGATRPLTAQDALHRNERFEIGRDAVRQGDFEARALGRDTLVSSYPRAAREVHFKFGLNGADNEFAPGTEQLINLRLNGADNEFAPGTEQLINLRPRDGRIVTPAYVFGRAPEAAIPRPVREAGEEGEARVTIRLDLRHVLGAIRDSGGYTPPQGARLTRLERVTVIGDTEPLTWDIRAVPRGAAQDLLDPDGDGIYETTLAFRTDYSRSRLADGRAIWARRAALDAFPALESPEPLLDATYRLSLEELTQLVRTDGALSAGAKWPGVWTRDVSFASLLALAIVAPDAVRTSLLAKVDSTGRIIQDTGTGGSWPISSDRLTWALAAWELYAVTGDRDWLPRSYAILARSVAADRHAVIDPATGLANGESSFLDWREQSYPRWMQPADIYQSQAIGTNAVHHGAYRILARMARALGDTVAAPLAIGGTRELRATAWDAMADSLRRAIDTHLWLPGTGWYGQFRYGRLSPSVSPRAEALGLALTVLQGVADSARGAALVAAAPQVDFGTPTFWPFIPDERFYHNGSIWPFVTAFATWAAADVRNTAVVEHGLASLLRGTALFLTNKENMVAGTGHFEGTALNSDRQLWSVAGLLAMQYRVLFGLRFGADSLHFAPMVPPTYAGERTLRGVRWRGATLDITVRGTGSALSRMRLDGADVAGGALPATLAGRHVVVLELDGRWPASRMRHVE